MLGVSEYLDRTACRVFAIWLVNVNLNGNIGNGTHVGRGWTGVGVSQNILEEKCVLDAYDFIFDRVKFQIVKSYIWKRVNFFCFVTYIFSCLCSSFSVVR